MRGHARPLLDLKNRSVSSENVPARAREWTRVPYSSFPRNEGVPGSSPGVGPATSAWQAFTIAPRSELSTLVDKSDNPQVTRF
jgi:hypothetical protein